MTCDTLDVSDSFFGEYRAPSRTTPTPTHIRLTWHGGAPANVVQARWDWLRCATSVHLRWDDASRQPAVLPRAEESFANESRVRTLCLEVGPTAPGWGPYIVSQVQHAGVNPDAVHLRIHCDPSPNASLGATKIAAELGEIPYTPTPFASVEIRSPFAWWVTGAGIGALLGPSFVTALSGVLPTKASRVHLRWVLDNDAGEHTRYVWDASRTTGKNFLLTALGIKSAANDLWQSVCEAWDAGRIAVSVDLPLVRFGPGEAPPPV